MEGATGRHGEPTLATDRFPAPWPGDAHTAWAVPTLAGEEGVPTMCRTASIRASGVAAVVGLTGLVALSASAASAAPLVWIDCPEKEGVYCTGITSAAGTVTVDEGLGVDRVYCQLYYYSVGNYDYVYWDWVSQTWHTGPTWDTMRLATGTDSWCVDSGFPAELPADPDRTYALYARAYDTNGGVGADVNYFYVVEDNTPPTIDLTILRPIIRPANNRMVLAATVCVQDDCDDSPEVAVVVDSTDPVKPPKGKRPKPDWEIVEEGGIWQVWLRAENSGRCEARIYTINVAAVDDAGNGARATGTVTVP